MCGDDGRRLNVSGVLRYLGVSRSGYNSWKNRVPSNREQRKNNIKHKICDIYDGSHQNYGAPKITAILNKNGETISEKTVGNYMREMGIRQVTRPFIMHSDRGCQYTSTAYIDATEGMTGSYSKKAYPWDNACIESFHSLLKREWINRFKIMDYKHAYKLVFEYIETFYNTVRIHSHCNYESPNEHEKKYWKELRKLEIEAA